ncbi:MAG: glutamate 5-kinase [Anaeroplasma sp.]
MRDFSNVKRIIVKIGSSSIVNSDLSINQNMIYSLMKVFNQFKNMGIEVALVSSGAIALGMNKLKLDHRPKEMALKQACAAVGQARLMEAYNRNASEFGLICGQILVNHDDFGVRKRMLYLSDTLEAMFKNGIIPIINENDALAVEEIKVGDNDTLASLIVPMINANLLVLFSDIDGLFNKNPKLYKDAKKIDVVEKINQDIYDMVGANPSNVGTGGMETKLNAAIISTNAGCDMVICNSTNIDKLINIIEGENIGTLFKAKEKGISSKEHWMIFKANSNGGIIIDKGLKKKLESKKVSILPKGIVSVSNEFLKGSIINILDEDGNIIAKGIVNYSSLEINQIKGLETNTARQVLNNFTKNEVIHANNLVMIREDLLC